MPQGLQIWDENRNLIIDVTNRISRVLGDFYTSGQDSGTIVNPELANGDLWYIADLCYAPYPGDHMWNFSATPVVYKSSADTLAWQLYYYSKCWNKEFHITYGVY